MPHRDMMIEIEIRKGKKKLGVRPTIFKGKWFSLDDLLKESLPHVFGEHLAKRLKLDE